MHGLKDEREACGLGAVEAAKLLSIGRNTLWRYENGKIAKPNHYLVERMRALYKSRCRRRVTHGPTS